MSSEAEALFDCSVCNEAKPGREFYIHSNGHGGRNRSRQCRVCENATPRKATRARVIGRRARQRATAALLERFALEFEILLMQERKAVEAEYDQLGEGVVLRPGPRREGQTTIERIDVARCKSCHTNHDRGHRCPACGSTQEET